MISGIEPGHREARRQMLYPILTGDALTGVVTKTQLESAVHEQRADIPLSEICIERPIVTHADQTLREVANAMAANEVDRMPVVDRARSTHLIGLVSLTMLLEGRLRDLREARESQRVLKVRFALPRRIRRLGVPATAAAVAADQDVTADGTPADGPAAEPAAAAAAPDGPGRAGE